MYIASHRKQAEENDSPHFFLRSNKLKELENMLDEKEVIDGRRNLLNEDKIKTIAYLPTDTTGCGYYRCVLPSVGLCRRGYPAHLLTKDRVYLYNIADSLVLQTQRDSDVLTLVTEAQDSGLSVIYEIDDNVWDIPKYNQAYNFWTDHKKDIVSRIIKACNVVTTTAPYLADVLRQFNPDVRIVPNAIFPDVPFDNPPPQLKNETRIMLGWIGASMHKEDLVILEDLIPKVLDKYKDVYFSMMGPLPTNRLNSYSDRVVHIPWIDSIHYHKALGSFSMLIGIAPLVDNEFNRCKSHVKAIEYMYMKTFPILSDLHPYRDIVKDSGVGMLVPTKKDVPGTIDDWMDRLSYCIEHEEETRKLGAAGHEWVMKNYNVLSDRMFNIYKEVYELPEI